MIRVMKRVILLLAVVLLASIGWSQTVTLKFKNGTKQQYNMSDIESIDFSEGDNTSGDDGTYGDRFVEVKIDGKTYKESFPEWATAQVDPFGTDSQGKKLTLTYDMKAHFEDTDGFLFQFGISHYRNKADLLASTPGSYPFALNTIDDKMLNNLAFSCIYELDGDEYRAVSGTHQVNSIESVDGDVCVKGSFTAIFKFKDDTKNIQGNYSIIIP